MEQLRLSQGLVDDMLAVLIQADERARDPQIAMQYLAAVLGYLLGTQDIPSAQKQEIHEHLSALARHVVDDVHQTLRQRQQPQGEAFGIWRPNKG
jgi:hypothetical protein